MLRTIHFIASSLKQNYFVGVNNKSITLLSHRFYFGSTSVSSVALTAACSFFGRFDRFGFGRFHANRPDAFRAAAIADKIDPMVLGPERHQVGPMTVRDALAVGPVGFDGPDIGLPARVLVAPLARLHHGRKGKTLSVGTPGRREDCRVGAGRDFRGPSAFSLDQVKRP